MRFVAIGCLCGGLLAAVGCADGRGGPTSPSATAAGGSVAPSVSASPRSGDLHVIKECSGFTGDAGSFCEIKSSNLGAIEVGSKIVYLQPDQIGTPSGSEIVLDPPEPGNNKAFGNCSLALGVCTFSGGTGQFTGFQASVVVSATADPLLWVWNGTYSFSPRD